MTAAAAALLRGGRREAAIPHDSGGSSINCQHVWVRGLSDPDEVVRVQPIVGRVCSEEANERLSS